LFEKVRDVWRLIAFIKQLIQWDFERVLIRTFPAVRALRCKAKPPNNGALKKITEVLPEGSSGG
jgi:hypothetical protein